MTHPLPWPPSGRWPTKHMSFRVVASVIILGISLLTPASVAAADEQGALGYSTPEEAVRAYLAAFALADAEAILDTVAIDEVAERSRFDLLVEQVGAFSPLFQTAPSEYDFYVEMNRAAHTDEVLRQARNLAYSLLTDVDLDAMTGDLDRAWAEDFVARVDPSRLDALTIVDVRTPDPERISSTFTQVLLARSAKSVGADEQTERVALVIFGRDTYAIGFTVVRYGDEWKVLRQSSTFAGTSPGGAARAITADEFDELTIGDD